MFSYNWKLFTSEKKLIRTTCINMHKHPPNNVELKSKLSKNAYSMILFIYTKF